MPSCFFSLNLGQICGYLIHVFRLLVDPKHWLMLLDSAVNKKNQNKAKCDIRKFFITKSSKLSLAGDKLGAENIMLFFTLQYSLCIGKYTICMHLLSIMHRLVAVQLD